MTSTDAVPDPAALRTQLAAALAEVQDRMATLRDTETALKARLLATTDGPDTYDAGPLKVVVTQAARLNLDAVRAKYPPDTHPELYELVPSTKAVRAHIAAVDLEPLTKYASPAVKVQ